MLNHSNKLTLVKAEQGSQQNSDHRGAKAETNGGGGGSSPGSDAGSAPVTPPESQSPLHFLADLAEQKSREEKKGKGREEIPMIFFSFLKYLFIYYVELMLT